MVQLRFEVFYMCYVLRSMKNDGQNHFGKYSFDRTMYTNPVQSQISQEYFKDKGNLTSVFDADRDIATLGYMDNAGNEVDLRIGISWSASGNRCGLRCKPTNPNPRVNG